MRIGIGLGLSGGPSTIDSLVEDAITAERDGFASVWMPNLTSGWDALTVLTVAGRETSRIGLGSFVIPTYPRHPTALAQQALAAQASTGNRIVLGIGLSHQIVIEGSLGLDYSRPVPHMREYLSVLNGLLGGEALTFQGEEFRVNARISVPGASRPPVIVAALGPAMLRLAGRLADGTATWMGGLAFLRDVAIPTITEAARAAGRDAPRIIAGLPICVTDNPQAARSNAAKVYEVYGRLPSYRATLDRGGAGGPEEIAVIGSEEEVRAQIGEFATAGVTDFNAAIFAPPGEATARGYEALVDIAKAYANG